jgi:hypothetical protein
MLDKFLAPILKEEGLETMMFQQNIAPTHFRKEVPELLNHNS